MLVGRLCYCPSVLVGAVRNKSTACDDGTFMFPKEFLLLHRNFGGGTFPLSAFRFPLSALTALRALEPALARQSKSKLFLCSRLLAALTALHALETWLHSL